MYQQKKQESRRNTTAHHSKACLEKTGLAAESKCVLLLNACGQVSSPHAAMRFPPQRTHPVPFLPAARLLVLLLTPMCADLPYPPVLIYLHFVKGGQVSRIQTCFLQSYLHVCKIRRGDAISQVYPSSPLLSLPQFKKNQKGMQALNSLQMLAGLLGQLLLTGFPW